ncbi:dephospho-CoA kinase [Flagellimonas taeanensis]|uniref:dephospho-CoA kinase n=1 Tax=Flavobacteriaceae TaxID=49546 RepID=UPI000E68BFC8|nr:MULTISPECIES: dephospho-CoA kinase [Allomuricauda]MDC6386829.1 dephospho-CoA kinase [Muricauda sp. SK9]RIV49308.1 dephospho-CoA kinase [Allomuricauda taeanensis]
MKIVGLTGGIGSGKSTVAKMFRELGVPVYDSDSEAKQLMASSSKVRNAIINLLGEAAYQKKELNRPFVAEKVFKDPRLLQKLNAIVHPAVREHFKEWAKDQNAPYVVQETALIFENGAQDHYDRIILVTAPLDVRLKRVMERDGVGPKTVLERMKNQMDDGDKVDLAHFCIENMDLETTRKRVEELHTKLMALAT